MILEAKVTNKGQVTLPIAIRKKFHVDGGGTIAFNQQGENVFIQPLRRHKTIEERFENYSFEQNTSEVEAVMTEIDTGEAIGEEI